MRNAKKFENPQEKKATDLRLHDQLDDSCLEKLPLWDSFKIENLFGTAGIFCVKYSFGGQ